MKSKEIARRYAEALYAVAAEDGRTEAMEQALQRTATLLREVPDAQRVFEHPLVTKQRKREFVEAAFPEIDPSLRNLLDLLITNAREGYLDLIADAYLEVRAEAEGVARVSATSASPLTDEERGRLVARLERSLGRPVHLDEHVDKDVMAGVRVEMNGRVVDATLRARLGALRQRLEQ